MNPANEIQPTAQPLPSPCDMDIDFPLLSMRCYPNLTYG